MFEKYIDGHLVGTSNFIVPGDIPVPQIILILTDRFDNPDQANVKWKANKSMQPKGGTMLRLGVAILLYLCVVHIVQDNQNIE